MSWHAPSAERRSYIRPATVGAWAVLCAAILGLAVSPAVAQDSVEEGAQATRAELPSEGGDTAIQAPAYHQLVPAAIARGAKVEVVVAGTIDHESLRSLEVEGDPGYSFTLVDASGEALEVVGQGKLPVGFSVAETVVVEGSGRDGRFAATEVLVPGANRGLIAVMAVTLVGWLGLFAYIYRLGRKLRRLEEE